MASALLGDGHDRLGRVGPAERDAWTQNPESTERLLNAIEPWTARPVDQAAATEATLRWGAGGPTPRELIFNLGGDPLPGYSWPPPRRTSWERE